MINIYISKPIYNLLDFTIFIFPHRRLPLYSLMLQFTSIYNVQFAIYKSYARFTI